MSRKAFWIMISVLAAVIVALCVADERMAGKEDWDECYGMANAHISWGQTFHGGAWKQ